MPTFYDSKGKALELSERLGSGGEGTVYVCPRDRTMVAKIYHEPISPEKAEKLRWMAENKDEQLLKVAAWVVDVLYDQPNGKVVGFLMPNVRAKEIHELYSLKSRRIHFPEATWTFLVHAAANLARAFYNLHKNDHVMGDVNHGNCVVLADGTVKLIDCDSYSISDGARRYRCEVGVATHLAPELQGISLRGVVREKKHDNFGLAVIIFQLLFLGRHPFAGNYLGGEDKTLEDSIREKRFAYGADEHTRGVKQPPGTLSLTAVPHRLTTLFERAFLTENRPEPREWIETLEDLKQHLKQCSLHPGHHFYENLTACPWCELEAKTGLMLFPFTSGNRSLEEDEEGFDVFTIENLLSTINVPQNLPAVLPKNVLTVSPEKKVETERRENLRNLTMFGAGQFLLIMFVTFALGTGAAFFIGLVVMTVALIFLVNNYKIIRDNLEDELDIQRENRDKIAAEWKKLRAADYFENDIEAIRKKAADYQNLQQDSRRKMKLLQDEALRYQLETHLAQYPISEAKISGVKKENVAALHRHGIKTAADVEWKRLQTLEGVDGFLSLKLLDWRKNLERNFEYQPNVQLPESSHQRVLQEFNEKRRKIEKDIENMITAVRMGANTIQQKQRQITAQAEKSATELMQAEVNLKAIGSNAPAVFTLLMVTGISLVLGNSFFYTNSVSSSDPRNYSSGAGMGDGGGIGSGSRKAVIANVLTTTADDYVPDSLSDNEISQMFVSERKERASKLYDKALTQVKTSKYSAEKKLLLAVKLCSDKICGDSQMISIYNQLGNIYFDWNRNETALDYFKKSLAIEPKNYVTENYIGMTYIQMGKNADAREVLTRVIKKAPDLFVAHYNLGLAFENEKNYSMAIDSYERAAKLFPDDADTQLALGRCYYKNVEFQKAENQYQKLLKIDNKAAQNLRWFIDSKAKN